MGRRQVQTAQSREAIALWHELWVRMTEAELKVKRLERANARLREQLARARGDRSGRQPN